MTHGWICGTCCDSFICFGLGDMTHGWICGTHVWHDSFICVTWLIHMCDVSEIPWLIHTCNVSQIRMSHVTCAKTTKCVQFTRANELYSLPRWLSCFGKKALFLQVSFHKSTTNYATHKRKIHVTHLTHVPHTHDQIRLCHSRHTVWLSPARHTSGLSHSWLSHNVWLMSRIMTDITHYDWCHTL